MSLILLKTFIGCGYAFGSMGDPEGGGGVQEVRTPTPLKNHQNIGFHSNTGPDPLKKCKATKPTFNVGPSSPPQRNAI